jgi:enterochelin esterase-like enzyme
MNSLFFPIFENMPSVDPELRLVETLSFPSAELGRNLRIDFYLPPHKSESVRTPVDVLLINDGQDLRTMHFENILEKLYRQKLIRPLLCIGIHAGPLRKFEYGTATTPDYKGRGNRANHYMRFITDELVPAIKLLYPGGLTDKWAIAGFSLGGLSALDIAWHRNDLFNRVGIFSGSLWWRTLDKDDPDYQDEQHRIMHNQIKIAVTVPDLKFFFECGTEDETADRNGNGIIDSIDDTRDLISALTEKGYSASTDICYHEIAGGKHDVATWAIAFPVFLQWAFQSQHMFSEVK